MSIEYTYEEERIHINSEVSLIVVPKREDCSFWDEVSIETKDGKKFIESYSTEPGAHEWMLYNSNYVAFFKYDPYIPRTWVKSVFDIQSMQMVDGTQEELVVICIREFESQTQQLALKKRKDYILISK